MNNFNITEREAKKTIIKIFLSIITFTFVYVVLVIISIGCVFLIVYGSLKIFLLKPHIFTFFWGLAFILPAIFVIVFLLKFIFREKFFNSTHLIELKRDEEPKLYNFIDETANEINTNIPNRIFLSPFVETYVKFNSTFFSLFFPKRKNLVLGMGLMNSITLLEFKSIVAHELGHFSQKFLGVSSYVYYTNKVLYNILYENDDFFEAVKESKITLILIRSIQSILKRIYNLIFSNFSKLSIFWEYQADEISAKISGSKPNITSLLRTTLSFSAWDSVLNYYYNRKNDLIVTDNIFPQHSYVLNYFAEKYNLPIEYNLPLIDLENYNKFNKSKLVIKDQWASHPPIEERVLFFQKLNYPSKAESSTKSVEILKNNELYQQKLTNIIFQDVESSKSSLSIKEFIEDFKRINDPLFFDPIFNHYYDIKIPSLFILKDIDVRDLDDNLILTSLYCEYNVRKVFDLFNLREDIEILKHIFNGDIIVNTFDYDGKKYSSANIKRLIDELFDEIINLEQKIKFNDINIYRYFYSVSKKKNKSRVFKKMYLDFFDFYKKYILKKTIFYEMSNATSFISKSIKKNKIEDNLEIMESKEKQFRKSIKKLLKDKLYANQISDDIKQNLENYISKKWQYYDSFNYNNESLNALYLAIDSYGICIANTVFVIKKKLLDFKINLLKL